MDEEVRVELVNAMDYMLRELGVPKLTRNQFALTYALAMCSREDIDWPVVNRAVVDRWSLAGLRYIKDKAWKLRAARDGV